MALEHRDWYRGKKPDWNNISFPDDVSCGTKKSKSSWFSISFSDNIIEHREYRRAFCALLLFFMSLVFYIVIHFFYLSPHSSFLVPVISNSGVVSQTFKYRSINNIKYLDVEINGVPFEVMLDTGASYVALNSDAIQKLGVKNFIGQGVHGTVNGRTQVNYFYISSFKLGAFEVKDVKCVYSPSNSYNLLGGSFLKHFDYSINESVGTITFITK